ncbi:MAG: hypothetical protein GC164_14735 [Phycisphaera sp.]|nr:hypothetical protein [Phycisphaera sp.]
MRVSATSFISNSSIRRVARVTLTLAAAVIFPVATASAFVIDFNGGAGDYTSNFGPNTSSFIYSAGGGYGGTGGIVRNNDFSDAFTLTSFTIPWLTNGNSVKIELDFLASGIKNSTLSNALLVGLKPSTQADDALLGGFGAFGGLHFTTDTNPVGSFRFAALTQPTGGASKIESADDGLLDKTEAVWYHFSLLLEGLPANQLRTSTVIDGGNLGAPLTAISTATMTNSPQLVTPYVRFGFQTNKGIQAFDNINIVPEPAASALVTIALACLTRRRREA